MQRLSTQPFISETGQAQSLVFCLFVLFTAICRPVLAGNFYAGTSPANVPWPGGIVPYEFTNTLTAAQTNAYLNGLREWELAANVTFVPHTTQSHTNKLAIGCLRD